MTIVDMGTDFKLTLSNRPPQQYNMKILLTFPLFVLLVSTTVAEDSCVDTPDPISSTRTYRTKLCCVIQDKLNSANNDNNEAKFNKVKKRNCGTPPPMAGYARGL